MFMKLLTNAQPPTATSPKEGDLFKTIFLEGVSFDIRYGFYEDRDRHTQFAEPMPLYPDFTRSPVYTPEGVPFVTAIQDICKHFIGKQDINSVCGDCAAYRHGDELIGTCSCPNNKLTQKYKPQGG